MATSVASIGGYCAEATLGYRLEELLPILECI
jgi:hypothetical protein